MKKTYYATPHIRRWEGLFDLKLNVITPDGCVGCVLVYESLETFEKEHPGVEPMLLETA